MSYSATFEQFYQLRDYQLTNNGKIREAFSKGFKRVLLQQPTGTGKSVQIGDIAVRAIDKGNSVMIIVPNDDLIQNLNKYFQKLGVSPGIIQGATPTCWLSPIIIASAATLCKRVGEYFRYKPALIIWDEVHHLKCQSWQKIANFFQDVFQVGFTATPCRLDGKGFDEDFDILIDSPPIKWFIERGYLSPYRVLTIPSVANVQNTLKLKGGNDKLDQQSEIYDNPTIIGDLVSHWKEHCLGQSTIVFATTIEHSLHIVEAYNKFGREYYGRDIAIHIDGKTPKKLRDKLTKEFAEGKWLIASNVNIFMEGVDFPSVSCVQFARITASLSRFFQMIGRGLRPMIGKICTFLDHVGLFGLHCLPDAVVKWTLKGSEKENDYNLICTNKDCKHIICSDYRKLREQVLEDFILCPKCENFVLIPKKRERESGERKDVLHDEKAMLVEIDLSAIQLKINSLVAYQRRRNNKPFSVVAKVMQLPGVEYKDITYMCDLLEYKRGFALQLYNGYQWLNTPGLTSRTMFSEKCLALAGNDWLLDFFWGLYEKQWNLDSEDFEESA